MDPVCANVASISRICIFAGSSPGRRPEYMEGAEKLGKELVTRKIGLVYGGGSVGVMGKVAATVSEGLGHHAVIGVIPENLATEETSGKMIGDTRVVPNLHKRKELMADLADAFVILSGGFGTLEEMLEVVTWRDLGLHKKPIGILNVSGFFDGLLQFFCHLEKEEFILPMHRQKLIEASTPKELLDAIHEFEAPEVILAHAERMKNMGKKN